MKDDAEIEGCHVKNQIDLWKRDKDMHDPELRRIERAFASQSDSMQARLRLIQSERRTGHISDRAVKLAANQGDMAAQILLGPDGWHNELILNDDDLAELTHYPLEHLDLSHRWGITQDGLKVFEGSSLKQLKLSGNPHFDDSIFKVLRNISLQSLEIGITQMTGYGLECFQDHALKDLRLELFDFSCSPDLFRHFEKMNLRSLSVMPLDSPDAQAHLFEVLPTLSLISLNTNASELSTSDLKQLSRLHLRHLGIHWPSQLRREHKEILEDMPLTSIDLNLVGTDVDEKFFEVFRSKQLKTLKLSAQELSPKMLGHFSNQKPLGLGLHGEGGRDEDVQALLHKGLQTLALSQLNITDELFVNAPPMPIKELTLSNLGTSDDAFRAMSGWPLETLILNSLPNGRYSYLNSLKSSKLRHLQVSDIPCSKDLGLSQIDCSQLQSLVLDEIEESSSQRLIKSFAETPLRKLVLGRRARLNQRQLLAIKACPLRELWVEMTEGFLDHVTESALNWPLQMASLFVYGRQGPNSMSWLTKLPLRELSLDNYFVDNNDDFPWLKDCALENFSTSCTAWTLNGLRNLSQMPMKILNFNDCDLPSGESQSKRLVGSQIGDFFRGELESGRRTEN